MNKFAETWLSHGDDLTPVEDHSKSTCHIAVSTALAIAGALASAAGTGVAMRNQAQAQKRQRQATAEASKRQLKRQQDISNTINAQVEKMRAGPRMQRLDEQETNIGRDLASAFARNQGASAGSLQLINQTGTAGRISGAAKARAKGARARNLQNRADIARLISRIEAPSALARSDAKDFNQMNTNVGLAQNFGRGDFLVDQQRIAQAGQPSMGGQLASGFLGAVGGGLNQAAAAQGAGAQVPQTSQQLAAGQQGGGLFGAQGAPTRLY